jgi:glutamate formiminotransferase
VPDRAAEGDPPASDPDPGPADAPAGGRSPGPGDARAGDPGHGVPPERRAGGGDAVSGGGLVEIVPNFSEGRRGEVVDEIVAAFTGAHPDVLLLDRSSDPDHNRSVLTLAGPGPALVEAAVAGAAACVRHIDLNAQRGVHPRIGALDVLPFVPLDPASDAVPPALEAGRRLVEEVGVPVYFYGAAARSPSRVELPSVRGGGFEELRMAAEHDPARAPDLGGPAPHPTAGATAVGVRPFLIAYNVNLATTDLSLARAIARAVRTRDGGLPALRALGLPLERRGMTQVSMNLLDFQVTGLAAAFDAVAGLAGQAGVEAVESEIVGLAPRAALSRVDPERLKLRADPADLMVEERIRRAVDRAHAGPQQGGFIM